MLPDLRLIISLILTTVVLVVLGLGTLAPLGTAPGGLQTLRVEQSFANLGLRPAVPPEPIVNGLPSLPAPDASDAATSSEPTAATPAEHAGAPNETVNSVPPRVFDTPASAADAAARQDDGDTDPVATGAVAPSDDKGGALLPSPPGESAAAPADAPLGVDAKSDVVAAPAANGPAPAERAPPAPDAPESASASTSPAPAAAVMPASLPEADAAAEPQAPTSEPMPAEAAPADPAPPVNETAETPAEPAAPSAATPEAPAAGDARASTGTIPAAGEKAAAKPAPKAKVARAEKLIKPKPAKAQAKPKPKTVRQASAPAPANRAAANPFGPFSFANSGASPFGGNNSFTPFRSGPAVRNSAATSRPNPSP